VKNAPPVFPAFPRWSIALGDTGDIGPAALHDGGGMAVAAHIDEGFMTGAALGHVRHKVVTILVDGRIVIGPALRDVGFIEAGPGTLLGHFGGVSVAGLSDGRLDHLAALNDSRIVAPAAVLVDEGPLAASLAIAMMGVGRISAIIRSGALDDGCLAAM